MRKPNPSPAYILGLDLGMLSDHAALVALETRDEEPPRNYGVVYMKQWPLMVGYETVISQTHALFMKKALSPRHDRTLVVDAGGVGRPVIELLSRKLEPIAIDVIGITITAGFDVVKSSPMDYRVPKRDLVGATQSALGGKRLLIADGIEHTKVLEHELKNMTIKTTKTGHEKYEALTEKDHDDMAMALSMALWFADQELPTVDLGDHWRAGRQREWERPKNHHPIIGVGLQDI